MKNIAASVRARILNQARETGEAFARLLETFAVGRFLYRLSNSPHRDRFVLKGAQLYRVWGVTDYRPTRDLDLLGYGDPTPDAIAKIFSEVIRGKTDPEDGIEWIDIKAGFIREDQSYGGVRADIRAELMGARIPLQVDVGFGDAITPGPVKAAWPSLLEFPAACLLVYPPETVVAEKVQAAVSLGLANSRMKDFYDLFWLASNQSFLGQSLREAIEATFARRGTPLPSRVPYAITDAFGEEESKVARWRAFARKSSMEADTSFLEIVSQIRRFLGPVFDDSVSNSRWDSESGSWTKATVD